MNKNEIIKNQIKELKKFGFLNSQQICDLLEPQEWLEPEKISGYKRIYSVPNMLGNVPIGISVIGFLPNCIEILETFLFDSEIMSCF